MIALHCHLHAHILKRGFLVFPTKANALLLKPLAPVRLVRKKVLFEVRLRNPSGGADLAPRAAREGRIAKSVHGEHPHGRCGIELHNLDAIDGLYLNHIIHLFSLQEKTHGSELLASRGNVWSRIMRLASLRIGLAGPEVNRVRKNSGPAGYLTL